MVEWSPPVIGLQMSGAMGAENRQEAHLVMIGS